MNTEKEYFLHLLSSFLNRTAPHCKSVDWQAVYDIAYIHDVSGIIAQQIKLLPCESQPDGKLKIHFKQTVGLTLQNYMKKQTVKDAVKSLFDENSIDHIFVKGVVVKDFYPIPELRTSGDIDVIVRGADFEKIKRIISQKNIKVVNAVSQTIAISIHDIVIEIHKVADVNSDYFDDIFALCNNTDCCTYALDDYNHLLYILCHLVKHLSYRGAGIRMLMDIDVLIRNIENFDCDRFINMCKAAGVEKSAKLLISLSNLWFDTPVKSYYDLKNDENLLSSFEKVMLDGGSFGYEMNTIPFEYVGNNSKFRVLLNLAFPDKDFLRRAYPYYDKHRILYFAARINRLIDGIFKKRKQAKYSVRQIFSDNDISAVQKELLQELDII